MKKILISDKLSEAGINYLNEQDGIKIHVQTGLDEAGLCEIIGEYDALLIRSDTKVTKKVLEAAKNLKLIGRAGIGVDNVDIPAATEMGVIVMNTPDANATTTAELAIAHMMSLSRRLPAADRSVKAGKWERSLVGVEIDHKTLGIIGFGTIGRIASTRGHGLKMNVIAYDPFVAPEIYQEYGVESVELDDLIARSDYITLHCPLIEKTKNILNAERLAKLKKGARIINCARGGLIDEAALYEALKSGQCAGAALDVFENEPPKDSPLLELDNIVFTPHLGASTTEAQVAVSVEIARQAVLFLKTGEAVNALNLPRVSAEDLSKSVDFMNLATALGKILAGLATKPITQVEVALYGKAAEAAVRPVSVSALVGVLGAQFDTPVNRVNAENIAKRQGIGLVESVCKESTDYVSLIKVTGQCGDQKFALSGALLGGRRPRLVSINHFDIEAVPEGSLIVTHHDDRPGVISQISSVLGNANINITRMQVSTADVKDQAMAVISVPNPVPDNILQQIRDLTPVKMATQINL